MDALWRRWWLLLILVPAAGFVWLRSVGIDRWNAGVPGLASGRLDTAIERGARVAAPWLQTDRMPERVAATTRFEWHEGAALHVILVAGRRELRLLLSHTLTGRTRVAGVFHDVPLGKRAERRELRGTVTLRDDAWGTQHPPSGSFDLEVVDAGRVLGTVRGTFR